VADMSPISLGVVTACAAVEALDALVVPGRATACRVAGDETLFVCEPDVVGEITREVETRLTVADTDAVVLAEVSRLRIPQRGFAQGDVAHVAAKVLVDDGGIVILAPAPAAHHVRTRIDHAVAGAR
jgi:hypothetical protein